MRGYFKKLNTETNWFKLFVTIFIIMTVILLILLSAIGYIHDVIIMNKAFSGINVGFAVYVPLIFSAISAGVVCSSNLKKEKEEQ
ncbi:hypothetical protein SAMN05216469_1362 [Ruminococcus albus]|uniref:Uncharacterized protein n=2 Tax=Ruminococcus albus TaxID=1264 RepID=A0A1H7QD41_RUMAL|nr:hypothetical protein SAMN05216469_1362 [Ruminococcus albus]